MIDVKQILAGLPEDLSSEEWAMMCKGWMAQRQQAKADEEAYKELMEEAVRHIVPEGQKSVKLDGLRFDRKTSVEYSEIKFRLEYPDHAQALVDKLKSEYAPKLTKTAIEKYISTCPDISKAEADRIRDSITGDSTESYAVSVVKGGE